MKTNFIIDISLRRVTRVTRNDTCPAIIVDNNYRLGINAADFLFL